MRFSTIVALIVPNIVTNTAQNMNSSPPQSIDLQQGESIVVPQASCLGKRAWNPEWIADDATWETFLKKGKRLMCLMEASDVGAGNLIRDQRQPPSAASAWQGSLVNELALWGWEESAVDQEYAANFQAQELEHTFEGLHINALPKYPDGLNMDPDGEIVGISINHFDVDDEAPPLPWQKYEVNGREYEKTGGFYEFCINAADGALIATDLKSPAYMKKQLGEPDRPEELPAIRHASDIFMAYWHRFNPDPSNLRIYFAHNVVNELTVPLLIRAFRNKGYDHPAPWPGHEFDMNTDEGEAILRSPMGSTIAHMLITHKATLGVKIIWKVTVLSDEPGPGGNSHGLPGIHLAFHIIDVPDDEPEAPESDGLVGKAVVQLPMRQNANTFFRTHTVHI